MCTVLWKINVWNTAGLAACQSEQYIWLPFDSLAFWDLILGLVVFKNQLTSCLCKAPLCMTFGRKNRRLNQWQFIILCLTLASLIVRIFATPTPVSLYFPQDGASPEWGLLVLYANQKRRLIFLICEEGGD